MGALVLLATAPAPSGFYEAGLGRFLISPGFGGVAVLIGGALAFFAARRSSADTRARTAIDAETARQERWWATLTWIYDRATAEREQARLTTTLALDLLDRLSRRRTLRWSTKRAGPDRGLHRREAGTVSTPTSPRQSTSTAQRETTAKEPTSSTQRGPARTGKAGAVTTASKASNSRPATAVRGRAARPSDHDSAAAQGRPAPTRREAGVCFPMTTTAQVEHRDAIRERTQARPDALRARTA